MCDRLEGKLYRRYVAVFFKLQSWNDRICEVGNGAKGTLRISTPDVKERPMDCLQVLGWMSSTFRETYEPLSQTPSEL